MPCTCNIQQIQPQTVACDNKEITGSFRFAETEAVANQGQGGSPKCGEPKGTCGGAEGSMCRPQKH